jgi:hypothetical protein
MKTPSQIFDEMEADCKALGYAKAAELWGISRHAMMNRIKKVYPDFKTNAHIGGIHKYTKQDCDYILNSSDTTKEKAERYGVTYNAMRQKRAKLIKSRA